MNNWNPVILVMVAALLSACASVGKQPPPDPFDGTQDLLDQSADYSQEELIQKLYLARSWVPHGKLREDPIALSKRAATPVNEAYTKILGPSYRDALRSLASKLWMIEHAEHTLDLTYYIFRYDPTGYAILGALCNAVKRGVDIRIMVDSLGSIHTSHAGIRAVETCADEAGYVRDATGKETPYKARVQFVIINALTSISSWANRRSHDKLIIKDGSFLGKDMVMTGGRNVSVDYYGIHEDGSRNPGAYLDLEIILRSGDHRRTAESPLTVGDVSGIYYSLLFLHKGNKRVYPDVHRDEEEAFEQPDVYAYERRKAQRALAFVKDVPAIKEAYAEIPSFLSEGYRVSKVRLAHELGNLVSEDVVTNVFEVKSRNTNSIGALLGNIIEEAKRSGVTTRMKIYETGKLDSDSIGGTRSYGKLHAKFFFGDEFGFVGTSNFDYRSRLYNNEMGFYYLDPALCHDLNEIFDELKASSLRWGSEEWLEMRNRLIASGGFKGFTTGRQRGLYKFLKGTGLIWLF